MVCGVWFTTLHHFWIKVCCNYIIVWSFYPFKKFHGPAFNKPCATTSVRELSVSGFLKVASSGLERYRNHPNPPKLLIRIATVDHDPIKPGLNPQSIFYINQHYAQPGNATFFCLQHTKSGTVNRKGRSPGRGETVEPPLRAAVLLRSPSRPPEESAMTETSCIPDIQHSTNFN